MKRHLNTLFVTTEHAYLSKDGESAAVKVGGEIRARVPLHNLGGIVCFGGVGASPSLMAACANAGVSIAFLTRGGRLMARVVGFTSGNVLLRRTQYRLADDADATGRIARYIVLGKLLNARQVLLRAARERDDPAAVAKLQSAAGRLAQSIETLEKETDADRIRGIEGDASRDYFAVFNELIVHPDPAFRFAGRSRRPPGDNVNALLSFTYTLLLNDARAACETVGLDAAVGFLHRDRPGRPSLALDLMEEFRAFLADRVVLTLINLRQVQPGGFTRGPTGGVEMNDTTRRTLITAYQKRKQEEITHPFLDEKTTVGLLVHLQARLLARYIRGELDAYPAFVAK